MKAADIIAHSMHTIRSNRLRSSITVAIIALGIAALIGIITAIEAMQLKLTESFSTMGAQGFTIRFKERKMRVGNEADGIKTSKRSLRQEKSSQLGRPITLEEAEQFRQLYRYPSQVSLSCFGGQNTVVASVQKKTNPSVTLLGTDENYADLNGFKILAGRNFTWQDIGSGRDICILGYDVATKLFGDDVSAAVNREVRIHNIPFLVIGVLGRRGSAFGFSRDNITLIRYQSLARHFSYTSFAIGVKAMQLGRVEEAIGEAEGAFRNIRKLAVTEESNFTLERSNSIAEKAMRSLGYITTAVMLIGFVTLIGAAIGLMNIMLVAVAERTREVGLIKAIGGTRRSIHLQYLSEAVILSLAGAVLGIVLGIGLGNLFSFLLAIDFIIPWLWIIYGIIMCTLVGLIAGIYPALKAGKLNPIEALRCA